MTPKWIPLQDADHHIQLHFQVIAHVKAFSGRHYLVVDQQGQHELLCLEYQRAEEAGFQVKGETELHVYDCPPKLLKLLSLTTDPIRLAFREQCLRYQQNMRTVRKLSDGTRITLGGQLHVVKVRRSRVTLIQPGQGELQLSDAPTHLELKVLR